LALRELQPMLDVPTARRQAEAILQRLREPALEAVDVTGRVA
jgi:hypothetical protein